MDKASIRRELASKRASVSPGDCAAMGEEFARNALRLKEIKSAKRVAVFLSVRGEIETSELVKRLLVAGKTLCVPVMVRDRTEYRDRMEFNFAELEASSELEQGPYGVPEPRQKNFYSPETIDIFFVPGLAFDRRGARVGWGKGHYDRFFNENRPRGMKVGACFDFQVLESGIPVESHDVLMDAVVTDKKTLRF